MGGSANFCVRLNLSGENRPILFLRQKERTFPFSSATRDFLLFLLLLLDAKYNEPVEACAVVSDRFFCFARIIAYEHQLTMATKPR